MSWPDGIPVSKPGQSPQQPSGEASLPPARTSGLAKASLVCGLFGLVAWGLLVLTACILLPWGVSEGVGSLGAALSGLASLTGVILGIWAIVRITDNPLKRKGRGLAIAGICVSIISLFMIPVFRMYIRPYMRKQMLQRYSHVRTSRPTKAEYGVFKAHTALSTVQMDSLSAIDAQVGVLSLRGEMNGPDGP